MKRNDVLFLCQFFYPEYNSSAAIPWDTARRLADDGISVGALCGYPKEYNLTGDVPLRETVEHVKIHRLRYIQLKRGKRLTRLINYFSFTFAALLHLGELGQYRCVIVYTNPPVLPVVAILGNILFHTNIISVSFDVYPEIAGASGQLAKEGLIDRTMRIINRLLAGRVSAVVALTEEMKEFLAQNRDGLDRKKITVIPNWAHETKSAPVPGALERFGYQEGDFIVSYFGNMGICQDIETLLGAMKLLEKTPSVKFLVIGHGTKKEEVIRRTKNMANVQVLDFLTGKDFEQAVAISSCSIVSLIPGLKGMCAPSKYYSYLQGGVPVIAVVEKGSYLEQEVEQEGIGSAVVPGDAEGLAKIIAGFAADREGLADMAERAEQLYKKKYEKSISLEKYHRLITEITGADHYE